MTNTITRATGDRRNASLEDIAAMLQSEHARKVDVVAPATRIGARDGNIVVAGVDAQLDEDGVTTVDGVYRPTGIFDEGIATKLGIPVKYVRRMRTERPDLYDANVNGWPHGRKTRTRLVNGEQQLIAEGHPGDGRNFLIRAFRGDEGGEGVARAFLSDRYSIVDNLDALLAALDGVKATGAEVEMGRCDLSDRRMTVRLKAPAIQAMAPTLLDGYRSPFTGQTGSDNPVVFAGLVITNSETGNGAFTITPQLTILVCDNGMTINRHAVQAVHLGGRMDSGVIRWSEDTQRTNIELIQKKTRDAVASFLNPEFVAREVAAIEAKAGKQVADAAETVKNVGKALSFTDDQSKTILDHFIRGGQLTAGGMANAVTSAAQVVDDPDTAAEMEESALKVLDLV